MNMNMGGDKETISFAISIVNLEHRTLKKKLLSA